MSEKTSWTPKWEDIDDTLENLEQPAGRKQITPRDYLKIIQDADKAFDSLNNQNTAVRDDGDIHTMLAQTRGVLSAEKNDFTTESCPRVSTQFVGNLINDGIPVFMDGDYFKLNRNRHGEKNNEANAAGKSTRK